MKLRINFSGRSIRYTEDEIATVVEAMRNAEPLDRQIVRIAVLIQPTLLYLCKNGSVVLKTNLYLLAVLFQIARCRGLSHCHATL